VTPLEERTHPLYRPNVGLVQNKDGVGNRKVNSIPVLSRLALVGKQIVKDKETRTHSA